MTLESVERLAYLAQTKFCPPEAAQDVIERRGLHQTIQRALNSQRLILISAPAGSGKTTVLTTLTGFTGFKLAWLGLDEDDNEVAQFILALVGALRPLAPDLGQPVLEFVAKAVELPQQLRLVAGLLINEIGQHLSGPFILVLDDLHWLTNPAVYLLLDYLLERMPAQMRLVIATRYDPPLALARLRARGQLAEIRLEQLRFSEPEAVAFFNERLGLKLSQSQLTTLLDQTQGWATALRLVAGSLSSADQAAFLDRLSLARSEHHIFDYLAEEVFDRQSAQEQTFLLQTSLLNELTPAVCQAVTGFANVRELLESFYRRNLFLIAVEGGYRYHDLFRDFLQTRLGQQEPEIIRQLHKKAAQAQLLAVPAIRHWLVGQWWEEAASAIEAISAAWLEQGLLTTLAGWLRILPPEVVAQRPALSYCLGRYSVLQNQWQQAQHWLEQAQRGYAASGQTEQQAECFMYLAYASFHQAAFVEAAAYFEQALALPLSSLNRLKLLQVQLFQVGSRGEWPEFRLLLQKFLELALELDLPEAYSDTFLQLHTTLPLIEGLAGPIEQFCRQVLARNAGNSFLEINLLPLLSYICLLRGQLEESQQLLERVKTLAGESELTGLVALDVITVEATQIKWRGAYEMLESYSQAVVGRLLKSEAARPWLALFLGSQAFDKLCLGQPEEAARLCERVEQPDWLHHQPEIEAVRLGLRGWREYRAGNYTEAETYLRQALIEQQKRLFSRGWNDLRLLLARLYLDWQQPARALQELAPLLTQAEQERLPGLILRHLPIITEPLLRLAASEGDHTRYAGELLRLGGFVKGGATSFKLPGSQEVLSARELEVLRLLAVRATNREIAQQLIISETTVKSHVQHILQKLNLTSRNQVAEQAQQLGLL